MVFAHKAFIETEYSNGKEAKETWLRCRGYTYEANAGDRTATVFASRRAETRESQEVTLFVKVAADIFSCDKHLLSGVTTPFFGQIQTWICFDLWCRCQNLQNHPSQANLYVRKMTVSDQVFAALEKNFDKNTCRISLHRSFTKDLPNSTRQSKLEQRGCVFSKEPIRRFALALISNQAFLGSKLTNPFHCQKQDLSKVKVYRNGFPIAGTPLFTDDEKRVYMTTMDALAFGYHGHVIPFSNYTNHIELVFDLKSTQQPSHDFLYPELTNAAVSVELKFSTALPGKTEVFLLGKKASTICRKAW